MFELDFRNIIVLVSLSIHASLLWLLYRYGRKSPSGRMYAVAIMAIAGWIFPMVLYRSHFMGEVMIWARLLYIMASFTSTTFLFFAMVFPDNKKFPIWVQLALVIENLLIVALCLHPTWMIQSITFVPGREDIINWGPLYSVYSSHVNLLFLAGFVILFLKWKKAKKGLKKHQIMSILLGYFVAANLAMTTNLILPWFGYFELNWIGQFFSTIVAVFTTYAIFRLQFMNIKVIATEGFLIILNLFVFFRFIMSTSYKDLMVNSIVWIAVGLISFLLMTSVKKEIRRREEVTKLAQSLEKANFRLKEIDKQKTDFLSIASHQLRTPLSVIKGYVELIEDGVYGKPTKGIVDTLEKMDESNEHLAKLVDEFLNITRIEQGRTRYVFVKEDMKKMMKGVLEELENKAAQKEINLALKPSKENIHMVVADMEKIRHVFLNFVDNAIKYSDKGTILIKTEKRKQGIAVRVFDNGLGFGKEDEANFFQKFYRGKNVEGINVTGTGLGLYVCRKFVENHGGEIWGHSEGLGKGSEFGYWLPFKVNANLQKKSM